MTSRHSFLVCRAAAFVALLITAGATSISVAAGAGAGAGVDRNSPIAGNTQAADFAQAQAPVAGGSAVNHSASL